MRSSGIAILVFTACALFSRSASATVDFQLSEMPKDRTLRRCQTWAASQHDAGTLMAWGRTKDAKSSNTIALLRLTLSCLGDDPPDVVYFGTSAGFNDRFCIDHRADEICKKYAP